MKAFANVCDRIAATAAKLEKISLLAEYLRGLENGELRAAARFLSGRPLGAREDRKVAIGGRTIVRAAKRVWGFDDAALSSAYRATGDLGDALGRFARAPADLGLFHETLTPATLAMFLEQAADATGKRAGATRMAICERILAAAPTEAEARYAIKVLTGDLRIGLREGLVIDAIAKAFDCDPAAVRRAVMAAGDLGTVAFAAREGTLAKVEVGYGRPI